MQIVIDIPEETYKRTKFYHEFRDLNDCVITLKAIDNAVPLPEGHGRLIDGDKLERWVTENYSEGEQLAVDISDAPTVLAADEEKEDTGTGKEKNE